jgi:hypothetical protein
MTIPLLDNVPENPHHALGLLFCEALLLQPLHKLERVEVVVFELRRGRAKVASTVKRGSVA